MIGAIVDRLFKLFRHRNGDERITQQVQVATREMGYYKTKTID